jgi:hypothetical protein
MLFKLSDDGSLLAEASSTSLYFAQNIIDLYYFNQTGDLISVFNKFKLTSKESMYFLTDYIYSYCLNNFALLNFQDNNIEVQGNSEERAFSLLVPIAIRSSVDQIKNHIKPILISKIIYNYQILQIKKDCNYYVSQVTNDSRLNEICDDQHPTTNMKTYDGVKFWVFGASDLSFFTILKQKTNFSDYELTKFYTIFISAINTAESIISNEYNCQDLCDPEYLSMLQWGQSLITLNPPQVMKNDSALSLSQWESDLFQAPPEYYTYINKKDSIIDLNTVKGLYYIDNVVDKANLQKLMILLNRNVSSSKVFDYFTIHNPINFFEGIRFVVQNSLLANSFQSYSNSEFLLGDRLSLTWINQGNYFDGFKPSQNYSTPLINEDDSQFKMRTGRDLDSNTRNILLINNANVYNSYSRILNGNKYINYNIPNFNNAKIHKPASDGFQNSDSNKEFFYFDRFSSRVYKFETRRNSNKNGLYCKQYDLSENTNIVNETYPNSFNEFGTIFTKFRKNFVVSPLNLFKSFSLKNKIMKIIEESTNSTFDQHEDDSYFCFDTYSDFLVNSEIKLLV